MVLGLALSNLPHLSFGQSVSQTELDEFSNYIKTAADCSAKHEYLCAAYNYSLAERTGIAFRDENRKRAFKVDFATSLYMLDKRAPLEQNENIDPITRQLIDLHNQTFSDVEKNLRVARQLLVEADHRNSYLYVAVTFDLIEQQGSCAAGSMKLLIDVLEVLGDETELKDFNLFDETVAEASRSEAVEHSANIWKCLL